MQRKAFITGVTGQDGSILSRFLLDKGYEVHGLRQYCATDDTQRISDILEHSRFHVHYGDLTDAGNLWRLLSEIRPDEIYNLGAQSHVKVSFGVPAATAGVNMGGVVNLLDAIRGLALDTRFYQASSSEMFGNAAAPQNEDTPMHPVSPYGVAKLAAYHMVRVYRESFGLHASNGILFNHESTVRGEEFVTRKITKAVAMIGCGLQDFLALGNLDARRDWGHAEDYIEGMWMMLQREKPGDYVLATGEARSVKDFVEAAFRAVNIGLVWQGRGVDEVGINKANGEVLVKVDPQFFRPNELHELIGDAAKARNWLGWEPKRSFDQLVSEMVHCDLKEIVGSGRHDFRLQAAE